MRRWEEPSRTTSGAPKSIAEQQQGLDQLMHKKKNEEKGTWILDRQPLHQKSAHTIRLPHLFLKSIRISISTLLMLKYHVMQFLNQSLCKWDFMSKHLRTMVYFLRSWIFRANGKWFILIWFFFMSQVRSFTLGQRAAMRAKTPRQQSNSLIWVALLFCGNTITISFQGESMKVRVIWSIWEISTKAW